MSELHVVYRYYTTFPKDCPRKNKNPKKYFPVSAEHPVYTVAEGGVGGEKRVCGEEAFGFLAGRLHQGKVRGDVRYVQHRQAMLPLPKEIPGPPLCEVRPRNRETVICAAKRGEGRPRRLAQ